MQEVEKQKKRNEIFIMKSYFFSHLLLLLLDLVMAVVLHAIILFQMHANMQ